MHLERLSLIHFKNYPEAEFIFSDGLNCFTGNNGAGKTNILDAIHYLCLTKSYFNPVDSQQIRHEEPFFVVQGEFYKSDEKVPVYCGVKRNHKKQFKKNGKEYTRLAEHIGHFPLVMISPYDSNLVTEGSEERRKFLDSAISQIDNHYLDDLIAYNRVLANRNASLKQFSETGLKDEMMVEVLDEQLVALGSRIFDKRKSFCEAFTELFNGLYKALSLDAEQASFRYESQLFGGDFAQQLKDGFRKDSILQRTGVGIHKDDLHFLTGDYPLKKMGSQGQQKTYLIAMKLAQYRFITNVKGYKPLLLLDDIFDKLDEQRIRSLLTIVNEDDFGQIFITDTDKERLVRIFHTIDVRYKLFEIERGTVLEA